MEDCEKTISEDGRTTIYTRNGQFVAKCIKTAREERWYNANGKRHRIDGPAEIYYKNGQKTSEWWYRDGKKHRDDGPAEIWYKNGQKTSEYWYHDGKYHCDDGPAAIYYENGQKISEYWYRNDQLHRDEGPATIWYENSQEVVKRWYRNDEFGGNVLAYSWLANVDNFRYRFVSGEHLTLDNFRDAVKSPLALELMRPLPIPIREAIYEHYCLQ
jgi:hypothetical protein